MRSAPPYPPSSIRYSLLAIRIFFPLLREGGRTPTDADQPPHHRMRLASSGTRSPVGVPPRLSLRRPNATAQPQAALPGTRLRNGRYPSPPVPVQRASRRPVIMPAGRLPRAARERGHEPRPRAPLPLRHSAVTGDVPYASEIAPGPIKRDACQYKRDGAFRGVMGGRKPRIHAGFRRVRMRERRSDAEPPRGPVVKSRSLADWAKCEKSLNGNNFGAASESFF